MSPLENILYQEEPCRWCDGGGCEDCNDTGMQYTEESIHAQADVKEAGELIDELTRPMYVFRMARACPDKPGSDVRMLNAARQILRICGQD